MSHEINEFMYLGTHAFTFYWSHEMPHSSLWNWTAAYTRFIWICLFIYYIMFSQQRSHFTHNIYLLFFHYISGLHIYSAIKIPILNYSLMCVTFRTQSMCANLNFSLSKNASKRAQKEKNVACMWFTVILSRNLGWAEAY